MKQPKIAISLAVVGALAAPFVFHTYEEVPETDVWTPLTAENRAEWTVLLKDTNNCQTNLKSPGLFEGDQQMMRHFCQQKQKALEERGYYFYGPSIPFYLFQNAAVAIASFVVIFGLTCLLPVIVRRYWRWLNT
jgi:hypothetical protein